MKPTNSPTPNLPDIVELTIDSLSYNGGRGVGRAGQMVVFVSGTVPGDRVRAKITLRKPRFCEAELLAVLEPSPHRRAPQCPVASRCGGCSWQQVTYEQQVEQKRKILRDSLRKLSGFEMLPFLPAPREFHYRNRIQLQIQNGRRGFFSKRSRDLVEFERCWISEEAINAELERVKTEDFGLARKVEIALGEDGRVHVSPGERSPEVALFSQVNTAQNEILKSRVLDFVMCEPRWIMDLYAGAGNLTFPLAQRFPSVPALAVELSRSSVERAQSRGQNIEWHAGDVAKVLKTLKPRPGRGLIVLDPPRVGLEAPVIEQVVRHKPEQIIYVSCNPSTFARDAERLELQGYRLEKVQGLDMFPQTEHVELIASFCAAH